MYIPISTLRQLVGDFVVRRGSSTFEAEVVELNQITLRIDKIENVRATADLVRLTLGLEEEGDRDGDGDGEKSAAGDDGQSARRGRSDVDLVVPDELLMQRVNEYAQTLAAKPPIALSLIKTGMNRLMDASFEMGLEFEADAQATCLGSDDFRTAMIAWLKKTKGKYTGA